jgi:hypothetical protein
MYPYRTKELCKVDSAVDLPFKVGDVLYFHQNNTTGEFEQLHLVIEINKGNYNRGEGEDQEKKWFFQYKTFIFKKNHKSKFFYFDHDSQYERECRLIQDVFI